MTSETEEHGESLDSTVRTLIRKLVGELSPLQVFPDARPDQVLRDELGYDSVRQVELTFLLEELFGFDSLVIEEAPFMETVSDLEDFTLDVISQGRAKVPSQSDIDRLRELIPAQPE
ncbi:acyl carrier protein [Streptomyces marianii]|uniref:Acyl carrier protein n=1 Tax=Streptomyces marianii TaxID=1817406 RepID=A0A5R9EEI2_9ACTN|nr:acyl carrier protein [Streptomyces marianii]TLQ46303.1 acyl carrier protein [Streptomyces marianii]